MITPKGYDSTEVNYRETKNWPDWSRIYVVSDNQTWTYEWISSPLQAHREKSLGYRVLMIKDGDGGYVAEIPTLRGCVTEGDTIEDALDYLRDTLDGWIKVAIDKGLEIPEPDNLF